jgi:fibronectin type 3 domain-containing protein
MFKYVLSASLAFVLVLAPLGWSGWMLTPEDESAVEEPSAPPQGSSTTASNKSGAGTAGNGSSGSTGGFGSLADETASPKPAAQKGYEVSLINAKKLNDNTIQVVWENPENLTGYSLTVYRGTNQLDTPEKLATARIMKQYSMASNIYFDRIVTSGKYYYAVTVTVNASENKDLTPDQSHTTAGIPMTITAAPVLTTVVTQAPPAAAPPATIPAQVQGLIAGQQNGSQVSLSWPRSAGSNVTYNVYRSGSMIAVSSDLKDLVRNQPETVFLDTLPQAGSYYYAVTAKNAVGENRMVTVGMNALSEAVVYAAPAAPVAVQTQKPVVAKVTQAPAAPVALVTQQKPAAPAVVAAPVPPAVPVQQVVTATTVLKKDYDYIMLTVKRRHFYSEDYAAAIESLTGLVNDPDCPEQVRNEAWLFLGKACYYTKDYAKALKIMVKVRRTFPDEADFWISRIAAKL